MSTRAIILIKKVSKVKAFSVCRQCYLGDLLSIIVYFCFLLVYEQKCISMLKNLYIIDK